MNKEFIPYEQALAMRGLGFSLFSSFGSETSLYIIDNTGNKCYNVGDHSFYANYRGSNKHISAPLYQQAFRWFRDKHRLIIAINPLIINASETNGYRYGWTIIILDKENTLDHWPKSLLGYLTYEEAELECLKKLIEIVKT